MSLMRQLRLQSPEHWRLWRKVTAVVAVPLIAATLFGALRVENLFDESEHYQSQAEQVSILPTLANFSTGVAGAAAATIIGLPTDNGVAIVEETEGPLQRHLASGDLDPETKRILTQVLTEGRSLLDSAVAGTMNPLVAGERADAFVTLLLKTFRNILDLTGNTDVLEEGSTLLDTWTTQWTVLDQVISYSALQRGTEGAELMWNHALASESAKLSVLGDSFASSDEVNALVAEVGNRRTLTANLQETGDLGALRNSLFASLMIYNEGVGNAATRVVGMLDELASEARGEALKNAIGVAVVLALALSLAVLVALSLVRPMRRLREDTLRAAEQGLPNAIAAIKDGAEIDSVTVEPVRVRTNEEIGEVARAIDNMNQGALRLAGEQAQLRRQVNEMLETLARRNKTLVEQQLALIDSLEHEERDPTRLQNLFALDHLAARMRRTGDSLLVLAGTRQRLGRMPDTPLGDVLRAAVSQVENYQRVNFGNAPEGNLVGTAVSDVVHLVAELLDNALRASPPDSTVAFAFSRAVDGGLLLEIADRGIGIPADELTDINMRLGTDSEAGTGAARRMGLFVVARLAARHGITVRLRPTFDSATNAGITASVYLPTKLLEGTGRIIDDQYQIERPRRLPNPPAEETNEPADERYSGEPYQPEPAAPERSDSEHYAAQPYQPEPYQDEPYQPEPYQDEPYHAEPYAAEPYRSEPYNNDPYPTESYPAPAYAQEHSGAHSPEPSTGGWERSARQQQQPVAAGPGTSPGIRRGHNPDRWRLRDND